MFLRTKGPADGRPARWLLCVVSAFASACGQSEPSTTQDAAAQDAAAQDAAARCDRSDACTFQDAAPQDAAGCDLPDVCTFTADSEGYCPQDNPIFGDCINLGELPACCLSSTLTGPPTHRAICCR